ncbi:MAG: hypothetical protein AAGU21_18820 [Solidesulfovibrio sp.]
MVGLAVEDRPQERGDIGRVMGTVGIDENDDVPGDMLDGFAQGIPLALAVVEDDRDAQAFGDGAGLVRRMAVHHQQFIGMGPAPRDDLAEHHRFVLGRYHHRYFHGPSLSADAVIACGATT